MSGKHLICVSENLMYVHVTKRKLSTRPTYANNIIANIRSHLPFGTGLRRTYRVARISRVISLLNATITLLRVPRERLDRAQDGLFSLLLPRFASSFSLWIELMHVRWAIFLTIAYVHTVDQCSGSYTIVKVERYTFAQFSWFFSLLRTFNFTAEKIITSRLYLTLKCIRSIERTLTEVDAGYRCWLGAQV